MAEAGGALEQQPIRAKNRVVIEGGAIDSNGQGSLLTTEECLLSKVQQRNPGMKRKDYEKVLEDYPGCANAIWPGTESPEMTPTAT